MPVKVKNETEYQRILANIMARREAPQVADEPPPPKKAKRSRAAKVSEADGAAPPEPQASAPAKESSTKRQGVKEAPIISSLRLCSTKVEASPTHVSISFHGARMFTLNELLAILQYRSYIVFAYKKEWQRLVESALKKLGAAKPHFNGPCKITLFRQGKKNVDRDSLMVMFKYIIDALKDDAKKGHAGIFPDDNPDIVYEDEKWQAVGEPIVGIRIDLIMPAPQVEPRSVESLFGPAAPSHAPAPAAVKKRSRKPLHLSGAQDGPAEESAGG